MTTQVFYRKWRPKRFQDLVGQEPIAQTLRQAVLRKRLAHAYLFCGPRGTGKTSTARILAKAANCLSNQDGEPCNICHLCTAVNEANSLDLIELDAASNRRIDDVRSIREKVHYSPAEGSYKFYILDEVHQLTSDAADALLKILEEPPAHVIFVLATTEPHNIPGTILSRCQRYDFRRIEPFAMAKMLGNICAAEDIEAAPQVLHAMARNADGSMRDAESLLEKAVTSFGSPLTLDQVQILLGLTENDRVRELVGHILGGATLDALIMLNTIASEGLNLDQLHKQMVEEIRELLLIKSGAQNMVKEPLEIIREQEELVQNASLDKLVEIMRLFGQVTLRNDSSSTLPLELAIIESAQKEVTVNEISAEANSAPQKAQAMAGKPLVQAKPVPEPTVPQLASTEAADVIVLPQQGSEKVPPPEVNIDDDSAVSSSGTPPPEWVTIIKAVGNYKGKRFLGAVLRGCDGYRLEEGTLYLSFRFQSNLERLKEELDWPESRRKFIEAVTQVTGISAEPSIEFIPVDPSQSNRKATRSPLVQAALSMGGRIIQESDNDDE